MRSRVNVQIGLGVRSSRACLKPSFSPTDEEALATGSLPHLQERSGSNLRVIESRMVKLAWEFMPMKACGDCCLIASVLQALVNPIFTRHKKVHYASTATVDTRGQLQ